MGGSVCVVSVDGVRHRECLLQPPASCRRFAFLDTVVAHILSRSRTGPYKPCFCSMP
jgi:hypothetical protein